MAMALVGYWVIGAPIGAGARLPHPARRLRPVDRPRGRTDRRGAACCSCAGAPRSAPASGRHGDRMIAADPRRRHRHRRRLRPALRAGRAGRAALGVAAVAGNVSLAKADAQHPRRAGARRARRHPGLAGRGGAAARPCRRRQRHPRRQRPRLTPCCPSRRRRRSPPHAVDAILAAVARARRRACPRRDRAAHQHRPRASPAIPNCRAGSRASSLMGGAFREGGNVTAAAEFNIWHDPEAARMVCPRLRRGRRRAGDPGRPRRDAPDRADGEPTCRPSRKPCRTRRAARR